MDQSATRYVRSRTSSTSSLRSPSTHGSGPHPATPAHTPNTSTLSRTNGLSANSFNFGFHNVNPDQLAAGLSRVRAEQGSRSSSIPPTPAPTPNPLLHLSHHMVPEQLVAGIEKIKVDEGYTDSTSFPATPAPSPFCHSPSQFNVFSPDQVAAGIQRLRDESGVSGHSTDQPPTPSTTPGPGSAPPAQILGVIPELLQHSIDNLPGTDEGLDSTSSPATPIQTPILHSRGESSRNAVQPEQLAAGIHRLKIEEGMSSGGSSGFPSTPAPTPYSAHPGGVQPEELAAGISRLSVIEESEVPANMAEPNLSQYFGTPVGRAPAPSKSEIEDSEEFFDNFHTDSSDGASVMHSCRESKVDLATMDKKNTAVIMPSKAEIAVSEQANDDEKSLQRRQSQEGERQRLSSSSEADALKPCSAFVNVASEEDDGAAGLSSAFDNIEISRPKTLNSGRGPLLINTPATPTTSASNVSSSYATPIAPTPVTPIFNAEGMAYSTYVATPTFSNTTAAQFASNVPITSPLPMTLATPINIPPTPINIEEEDTSLTEEEMRMRDLWIPSEAVRSGLTDRNVDRTMLTSAAVQGREELQDPVRNMVLHYRGEAEAAKRNVLTANDVPQDMTGLNQLIRAGCLRSAINLTTRLLTRPASNVQHTPASLKIWHVRMALLVKLKQFNTVEAEAAAFADLDKIDLYYDYYSGDNGGRRGSMVPFAFRVLLAELPLHLGKHLEAMDGLYAILAIVNKILTNLEAKKESTDLWVERKIRVLYALANCGIQQRDFEMGSTILDQVFILEKVDEEKAKVRSIQGRVFLQLGDTLIFNYLFLKRSL
jgi:hypothetical protein